MTRRGLLTGGCAALAMATSEPAYARGGDGGIARAAPRADCTHGGCRHHRPGPDGAGLCGLSLHLPLAQEIR